eukprot:84226_1
MPASFSNALLKQYRNIRVNQSYIEKLTSVQSAPSHDKCKMNNISNDDIECMEMEVKQLLNALKSNHKPTEIEALKQFILDEQFDYECIVDDMKVPEDQSDILEDFGLDIYIAIKQYLNKKLYSNSCDSSNQCSATKATFKNYKYRLNACNGDCGSALAKFIAISVHQTNSFNYKTFQKAIEDAFWCYGNTLRNLLIKLLKDNDLYKQNDFYHQIYNCLIDPLCFVIGRKWLKKMRSLFTMLSQMGHIDILQKIANASCKSSSSSLLQEADAYYNKIKKELKEKLNVIESMIKASEFSNIKNELLQHKQQIEAKISNTKYSMLNKKKLSEKIVQIRNTKQFKIMKQKHLELSHLEILSIILYCDYNEFVYNMRKSHRDEKMNSCEWRKLFGHLHSAITKIHTALHFQNNQFYRDIQYKCNNKLFRGDHGISLIASKLDKIMYHTITSFSESFEVAKDFAYPDGMILSINNAYEAIYNGDIISANVSWISQYRAENEWIVLPTEFRTVRKVYMNNKDLIKHQINPAKIDIYEADISRHKCNFCDDKAIQRFMIKIYWVYCQLSKASTAESIIAKHIRQNHGSLTIMQEFHHIIVAHYDDVLQMQYSDLSKFSYNTNKQDLLAFMSDLKQCILSLNMIAGNNRDRHHLHQRAKGTITYVKANCDIKGFSMPACGNHVFLEAVNGDINLKARKLQNKLWGKKRGFTFSGEADSYIYGTKVSLGITDSYIAEADSSGTMVAGHNIDWNVDDVKLHGTECIAQTQSGRIANLDVP